MRTVDVWKRALRAALKEAMRARQPHVVAVLRETLGAIDNAEAAEASAAPAVQHGGIAGGVSGLGAGDVARRVLSVEAVNGVVERELQERRAAAATYLELGKPEQASTLQLQVEVLAALLKPVGSTGSR